MKAKVESNKYIMLNAAFNFIALAFIYFVPAVSHLLNFPLYLIEPMRLMLVLALVHTNRVNAYIIALTLPLFSFMVSSHPHFFKMVLIALELVLNVWLFHILLSKTRNAFASIILSIILSKGAYYALKFGFIAIMLIPNSKLIATPLYIQGITTIVFALYLTFLYKKR